MRRTTPPNYVYRPPNARPIHLSVLGKRIRLPAICARVPLRQLFKGVSGRGLVHLRLLDRAFPRTKSAKAKSLVMPFPRPVQLTQIVGSVCHVVEHLPFALMPNYETPAKNMHLCGILPTHDRCSRRIAAGPLPAMSKSLVDNLARSDSWLADVMHSHQRVCP